MSETRGTYNAGNAGLFSRADYLRLTALAFDYAEARTEYAADTANSDALNDCVDPEMYERWCRLCELIALDKITEPGRAVDYLQGDK